MYYKGRDLRGGHSSGQPGRQLVEVAKAVGGGYCRLQLPLAVRETLAGHRLGSPVPMHPWLLLYIAKASAPHLISHLAHSTSTSPTFRNWHSYADSNDCRQRQLRPLMLTANEVLFRVTNAVPYQCPRACPLGTMLQLLGGTLSVVRMQCIYLGVWPQ